MLKQAAPIPQNTDTAIAPIAEHAGYSIALQEVHEIERALDERQSRLAVALARRRGEKSTKTAAERAAALISGGRFIPVPTDADIEAINEEIALLRDALFEKHETLDRIAHRLSIAESKAVQPLFDAYMKDALAAMRTLNAAFCGAAELAAALYRAGYTPSAMTLPHLVPSGARLLGDPDTCSTEAWYFARAIEARRKV